MAYRKQERGQNHPTPMKSISIAALVLAASFLTTGGFAENTVATPASPPTVVAAPTPALDRIASTTNLPGAEDPAHVAAMPEPTDKQIAQLEHEFSATYQASDGLEKKLADQTLRDARAIVDHTEQPTIVFSEPPFPVFSHDANAPAYWYPSITFRFDWGRNRRG